MKLIQKFTQSSVIDRITNKIETQGVCFRLTFKWAATALVGKTFNSHPNADKTAAKHSQYRQDTLAIEKRLGGIFDSDREMLGYLETDYAASRKFAESWSKEFTTYGSDLKKSGKASITVHDQTKNSIVEYLKSDNPLENTAILAGFYGRQAGNGKVWGHVVAFCSCSGSNGSFFDSNVGIYAFEDGENRALAVDEWIHLYLKDGRTITNYNTLILRDS